MKCRYCGVREATQKHHIWFGRGERDIADKYNLTIDLCICCHIPIFHSNKRVYQIKACQILGLEYSKINPIMKKPIKLWKDDDYIYMKKISEKIKEMEYNELCYYEKLDVK